MAPSPNRRPGNSRRAQYGTFFGYFAGVLGAAIGVGLLVISMLDPAAFATLRGAAADVASPAAAASTQARRGTQGVYDLIAGYVLAGSRGARLESDMRTARTQLAQTQALADENRRLKALLGLAIEDPRPIAVTQLISGSGASTRRLATIAAGRRQGVATGMPVRSPLGLIGRVLETGATTARVLLITDSESVVPVRRATDGVPAFAQGRGDGRVQIRLINLGVNPLRRGDVFVTSGSGGLYRPGVAVAAIAELTRDGGMAELLSDPAATDYVAVERQWSPDAVTATALPPPAPPAKRK